MIRKSNSIRNEAGTLINFHAHLINFLNLHQILLLLFVLSISQFDVINCQEHLVTSFNAFEKTSMRWTKI